MKDAIVAQALGYPLFGVASAAVIAGLATGSYWPMALGLAAMAFGALQVTARW